jgi:energy-coupling factor transporter transmembrane protein EcfT
MKNPFRYIRAIFSILAFVICFIIPSLSGQLIVLGVFLILSLINDHRKKVFKLFFRMSILLVFTLIVHLFFRFGEDRYWQAFAHIELWNKALFFTFRNANILLIMSYLIKSGNEINFATVTGYLEGRQPAKFIQPLTLAMRYVGLISEEFRSLQQVHRIMGIKKPTHLIAQAKYYISLVAPTIISSLERADHLSIAMTSRGYNQNS